MTKIHVPEADGMPLERWTAYMHCKAHSLGLSKGQFYLGEEDGKSYIYKGQMEITDPIIEITWNELLGKSYCGELEFGKCYRILELQPPMIDIPPEYPHDFNPLRDEPFNKYRKEQ